MKGEVKDSVHLKDPFKKSTNCLLNLTEHRQGGKHSAHRMQFTNNCCLWERGRTKVTLLTDIVLKPLGNKIKLLVCRILIPAVQNQNCVR